MYQIQFTLLYKKLERYAYQQASIYFQDESLCQDATDFAMDVVIDKAITKKWIENDIFDEDYAKGIIRNSVVEFSKNRKLEPINLMGEEYDGMHGYKIIKSI